MQELIVKSNAFDKNMKIPEKYTCDGEDVNPPLTIQGTQKEAKTFVLIMDDPDAPRGTFDHWVVWNIPASTVKIDENAVLLGIEGKNSAGKTGYYGPCPPSGMHRYFFKVYALDAKLDLPADSRKTDVEREMKGHILANGELVGLYR
jgi:Raf kinase inhibitor-like YbhB/YbcL family protein